jgi:hypothetical protein
MFAVRGLRLMDKKVNRILYWVPRVLSIIFIFFLALMSFDVVSSKLSFWQIFVGMLMHNIPTFILLIVLIISWKYEIVGGIAFILAGLIYIIITSINVAWYLALSWSLTIAGPAFLIGVLFMINWFKKKQITRSA